MPAGRPSLYTPDLVERVLLKLALGWSLRKIEVHVDDDGVEMPHKDTILTWRLKHEEFAEQYARAQEMGCEAIREEMREIADDGTNDFVERLAFKGGTKTLEINGEAIQRSRLRWEDRRWYLGKKQPAKWGEQVTHSIQGVAGAPPVSLEVVFVKPKEEK